MDIDIHVGIRIEVLVLLSDMQLAQKEVEQLMHYFDSRYGSQGTISLMLLAFHEIGLSKMSPQKRKETALHFMRFDHKLPDEKRVHIDKRVVSNRHIAERSFALFHESQGLKIPDVDPKYYNQFLWLLKRILADNEQFESLISLSKNDTTPVVSQ